VCVVCVCGVCVCVLGMCVCVFCLMTLPSANTICHRWQLNEYGALVEWE